MNIPGFTAENSLYQVVAYGSAQNPDAPGKRDLSGSTRVFASQVRQRKENVWGPGRGGPGVGGIKAGDYPVIDNSAFCKMDRLFCFKRCSAIPPSAKELRTACRKDCAESYTACRTNR